MAAWSEEQFIFRFLKDLGNPGQGDAIRQDLIGHVQSPDWDDLIHRMSEEGISFLYFYYSERFHLTALLPAGALSLLSVQYYANLKRNMAVWATLRLVFNQLHECRLPFIVLKGIALAERVYPGFATRGMSDADILVRREDVCAVDACLSGLGYYPMDSTVEQALDNPVGYLASLDYQKQEGSLPNLHIHWHPVNTSVPAFMFADKIDLPGIWQRAVHTEIANAEARILCPEHQVIYLCEHALRINHSFDRLVLVLDIFYAVHAYQEEINWDFVVEEARRFNLSRVVFLSLSVVRYYTSLAISEEILRRLCPEGLTWGERFFLKLQFNNRRFRGSSILVYLAMNQGLVQKGRFLYRILFPPRHILMQRRYDKNGTFGISYYFLRFREVFVHLLKISRHRS